MPISGILTLPVACLQVAGRVLEDVNATSSCLRLFSTAVECMDRQKDALLMPLLKTFKVITDFTAITTVFPKVNDICGVLSGRDQIVLDAADNVQMPNILKLASRVSLLGQDGCTIFGWLESMDLVSLGSIASSVANIPVFGVLVTMIVDFSLSKIKTICSVVGAVFNIADLTRQMLQNGITWTVSLKIVGDLAKIATALLIGPETHIKYLGLVSRTVGSVTGFMSSMISLR